jgi:peptidoglycan/xylan/chitin deacetylase (PgdA/CDA1 family)
MNAQNRSGFEKISRLALKSSAATLMHWSDLDHLVGLKRGLHGAPLVIGYHRVVEDFRKSEKLSMPSMLVSKRTFAEHLQWIGKKYDFVSLDDLACIHDGTRTQKRPVAAITFDDGYRDYYHNAFPLLERMGIPSAVFVVTDLTGTARLLMHDELHLLFTVLMTGTGTSGSDTVKEVLAALVLPFGMKERVLHRSHGVHDPFRLTRVVLETLGQADIQTFIKALGRRIVIADVLREEFRLLDWGMLKELVRHGVTVGSHTCSHVLLDDVPQEVVRSELTESRHALEKNLGVPVHHFAYPDGRFNAVVISEAAVAGYRTACTICSHRDITQPLLTISRKMLWENSCMDSFRRFSPAILSCQVNGIFDPASKCRLQHWPLDTSA